MSLTLMFGGGILALALFAGWRGARPPNPHRGPRMIPWRLIMVSAAALLLAMIVHLVTCWASPRGVPAGCRDGARG